MVIPNGTNDIINTLLLLVNLAAYSTRSPYHFYSAQKFVFIKLWLVTHVQGQDLTIIKLFCINFVFLSLNNVLICLLICFILMVISYFPFTDTTSSLYAVNNSVQEKKYVTFSYCHVSYFWVILKNFRDFHCQSQQPAILC